MSPKVSASQPARSGSGRKKAEAKRQVTLPHALTVGQLADLLGVSAIEVIKNLMKHGVLAAINQVIDYDTAAVAATDFGYEPHEEPKAPPKEIPRYQRFREDDATGQKPRPPVITIMGHVDHGKTSLLDAIRETNVIATEAGSITQHIGAYQVELDGQKITFLDTPGHEAFTAMRARGAQVTDIAVLVVAADDGVMPQTVEAVDHARAAQVPIVVAINKIDKPNANPERVKQQLADMGLLIEEWGGDVICVSISAKKREGISDLLENLLLVAEISELKANPNRRAAGVVIEARLDRTKGSLATMLVQTGILKVGDNLMAGSTWGKVKAMFNERGKHVKKAEPSMPVEVLGLSSVPQAGDTFSVATSEKEARNWAQKRQQEMEQRALPKAFGLEDLYSQIKEGQFRELNLVLKTDVQGSIEPLRDSLEGLTSDQVKVRVIHSGSGNITESDVMLALASKGIIIGFNTRPEPGAKRLAEGEGVDVRFYSVIYNLVEDIKKALVGMLEPTYVEVIEGHAEVLAIFPVRKGKVAGVRVTDGKISRGAQVRVMRQGETAYEGTVTSLRHFKEDVREMGVGSECGVGLEGYSDFEIGDILETYRQERAPGR